MSTQKITDLPDVRPGDSVTIKWLDSDGEHYSTVTGTVRRETGILLVGPAPLTDRLGGLWSSVVEWSATREEPELPIAAGSVILDVTVRGERAACAFLDDAGVWTAPRRVGGLWSHLAEHITAWTPARIVPDGEPVQR